MRRDAALEALSRIQEMVRHQSYDITPHAMIEALKDDLHPVDVESAVLTGTLTRVQKGDARGTKYTIVGQAADLERRVAVVARFKAHPRCVIITVYEVHEG